MEKFKAVEKEMKTKAFSKEGLSAAAKLDPKEKEKQEVINFLGDMVEELSQQIETYEAESETLGATGKRGKKADAGKLERKEELERMQERHKFHIGKLEVLKRALDNGSVDVEQVKDIEEGIKYYVEQNQEVDFMEDDALYDELDLDKEEDLYGIGNIDDKVSSQDAQSVQDEPPEAELPRNTSTGTKSKSQSVSGSAAGGRRASTQASSTPLPALATLHTSLPNNVSGKAAETMKPAPLPSIPTGQPLKYASAAAAAAASDKNGVGIAPLPPPPGATKPVESPSSTTASVQPVPPPAEAAKPAEHPAKIPTPAPKEEPKPAEPVQVAPSPAARTPSVKPSPQAVPTQPPQPTQSKPSKAPQPPSPDSGIAGIASTQGDSSQDDDEEECIYHLPSSLTDLLDSFEETKQRAKSDQPYDLNMLNASRLTCPTPHDSEKPNHYKPQNPYNYTPAHYPQEPSNVFDDPRLYNRIDTDSLFYAFYYRQGTYQQYLAAKALKGQSWRFHKQYQTWFQRHEEPKNITEEFEQGTYRFFDYESTW